MEYRDYKKSLKNFKKKLNSMYKKWKIEHNKDIKIIKE